MNTVDSDDDFMPPKKKVKMNEEHFKPPSTDEEMAILAKGFVPRNTQRSTAWAIKVFSDWKNNRNSNCVEHGFKNRSGGVAQLHVENKCVPCYATPQSSPECLVFHLDLYL